MSDDSIDEFLIEFLQSQALKSTARRKHNFGLNKKSLYLSSADFCLTENEFVINNELAKIRLQKTRAICVANNSYISDGKTFEGIERTDVFVPSKKRRI